VADPKILKRGGGGRQFISPVVIYRKYTERNICLLQGKSGFLKKKSEPIGAAAPTAPFWIRHWLWITINFLSLIKPSFHWR